MNEEQIKEIKSALEANIQWVEMGFLQCKKVMTHLMQVNLEKEINSATDLQMNMDALLQTLLLQTHAQSEENKKIEAGQLDKAAEEGKTSDEPKKSEKK